LDSFIWKNQNSYLDYGIVITEKPSDSKAEKNVDEIPIPGRDGDLTFDYGTYKPLPSTLICTLLDDNNIDAVKSWLDGYDKLIFSWRPGRYFDAKLINRIDIAQTLAAFGEFPLIFKTQPHVYAVNNSLITLTAAGSIFNPGSYKSKPVIKIYGTGAINLTINGNVINLTNVVAYVTVDSELMDCYKDTDLKNNYMAGEFPELLPGENIISWTGTVTKIEITPNFRWL